MYTYSLQLGDHSWRIAQKYHKTSGDFFAANLDANPYYLHRWQPTPIPVSSTFYHSRQMNHCISQAEVYYRNDMRSLWEEHVAWTRMAIISLIFKLPDVDFVIIRLLQNATDMGNMVRKLYGDLAATTYSNLIKEHLLFAADLVKSVLAGDMEAAKNAENKWYMNADQIAKFLSSVNPFLPENVVKEMFYRHLELTKQEAVFMMNMDYQKDIEVYDAIEKQAREMADTISDAMIKLYPHMF